jgi:uncharacterized hydrophobic protein (TIGR00271 family)
MKDKNRYLEKLKIGDGRKKTVISILVDKRLSNTDFLLLIFFSSTIATLGLIANLPAVTIGAQLIDPLMSPILGLAIAYLSDHGSSAKRSIMDILKGVGSAVVFSSIISFFMYRLPYGSHASIPFEVIQRTTATFYDLGIAAVGGAAAAYATARPGLNSVLPGVAIATALMPPLCAVGFGIAIFNASIIFGAILQFLTNFFAISSFAVLTFAILGFLPKKSG